jgi:arylsulfatase A-like enzyme
MNNGTSRRDFLRALGAGAMGALLPNEAWADVGSQPSPHRPNIVFLFSDDHARRAISAYGDALNQTPQIDRLARDGAILWRNTVANSICGPSRACVLTGTHSHINGMRDNATTFDGSQTTFPKLLQAAGYQTALFGKWHLVSTPTGFDTWRILPGQGHYYNPTFLSATGKQDVPGYNTHVVTGMALDWLQKQRQPDRPFLMMLHYKAPHRNWEPALEKLDLYKDMKFPAPPTLFDDYAGRGSAIRHNKAFIGRDMTLIGDLKVGKTLDEPVAVDPRMTPEQRDRWIAAYRAENEAFLKNPPQGDDLVHWKYQRYVKDYLRCVASVDDSVGQVLDYLDRAGLAGNTVVVYSSDQGFYLGENGLFDKRWMYETSFTMPFLVRWPGRIQPGTRVGELTQNIDFAPTFLEAAGLPVPTVMQGRSFLPLLRGEKVPDWRQSLYYHYYDEGGHGVPKHEGVSTQRHKLINYYTLGEWELFDLEKDPQELRSVYDHPDYAGIRRDLHAELDRLRQLHKAPPL